jgi:hypothetical protein
VSVLSTRSLLAKAGLVCGALAAALVCSGMAYVRLRLWQSQRLPRPERSLRELPLRSSAIRRSLPPPGDRRCHMDRLASVEHQLLAHFLDTVSLLRLARCSRSLRHDLAHQRHAWIHANPVVVHAQPSLRSAAQLERVLPPHARLHFKWLPPPLTAHGRRSAEVLPSELEGLRALQPRLFGLDASCFKHAGPSMGAWTDAWPLLHEAGVLVDLRRLVMVDSEVNDPTLRPRLRELYPTLMAGLPHLHTLVLMAGNNVRELPHFLPLLPSLTALALVDRIESVLAPVLECRNLKRLHVSRANLIGEELVQFCSHPTMRGLEHLTLARLGLARGANDDNNNAQTTTPEHLRQAFQALTSLHTLQLLHCGDLVTILREAHHCPSLRFLLLEGTPGQLDELFPVNPAQAQAGNDPNGDGDDAGRPWFTDNLLVLQQLLSTHPRLQVRLLFPLPFQFRTPFAGQLRRLKESLVCLSRRRGVAAAGAAAADGVDDADDDDPVASYNAADVAMVDIMPERFVF